MKKPSFPAVEDLIRLGPEIGLQFGESFLLEVIRLADQSFYERSNYVRKAAVGTLVKERHPSGMVFVNQVLSDPDEYQEHEVEEAWEARFQFEGLQDTVGLSHKNWQNEELDSFDKLPVEQRYFCLIETVKEVARSGFDTFVTDPLAPRKQEIMDVLAKVGCKAHGKILDKLYSLYGKWPMGNQEAADEYCHRLPERKQEKFEKLGEKFRDLYFKKSCYIAALEWDYRRQTGSPK